MIVVMAAGLVANLTVNPLEAVTTVTVQIVTLLDRRHRVRQPQDAGRLRARPRAVRRHARPQRHRAAHRPASTGSNMTDSRDRYRRRTARPVASTASAPSARSPAAPLCRRRAGCGSTASPPSLSALGAARRSCVGSLDRATATAPSSQTHDRASRRSTHRPAGTSIRRRPAARPTTRDVVRDGVARPLPATSARAASSASRCARSSRNDTQFIAARRGRRRSRR